jgi:hypothetical protein
MCNKCGDVWHVVVAKVGDKIAKVQCKQCNGYHRYRPTAGSQAASPQKRAPVSRPRKESARPSTRIDAPQVEPDTSRPIRPYEFRGTYQPGDRIEHPTFGIGVVELLHEPGKMQVFFSEGRRVLALAKPESQLTKPQPFRHESGGGGL